MYVQKSYMILKAKRIISRNMIYELSDHLIYLRWIFYGVKGDTIMSNSEEIRKFLQEEIEQMQQSIGGVKHNNYYYNDSDNQCYYEGVDTDDRDCSYYEDAYYNIINMIDRQYEEMEDAYYDLEEFYANQKFLIEPVKTELQKAKEFRMSQEYQKAIAICDDLLKKNENNRYAVDLKIAALGDIGSPEAYNLAIFYMKKYARKLDYIHTMFGLLQKMHSRKDEFIKALYKYCPECLEVYVENLGENNPKRTYLKELMRLVNKSQINNLTNPEGD